MKSILAFSTYTVLMIVGQLCSSNASKKADDGIFSVLSSASFWTAVVIYGFASVAWVFLLRIIPVSIAYPTAAAVTSIMLYLWFVFNGGGASLVKPTEFIGIILLIVGLFLVYANRQ